MEDKRGYATAEVEEIVRRARSALRRPCRHFGACGGCHYQHADYATQLSFKQAILRETLERGGVHAPDEIRGAGGASRGAIAIAFGWRLTRQGNLGYRGRRSHAVIPIERVPDCSAAAGEGGHVPLRDGSESDGAALAPTEISLFCNAEETALLASVFVADPSKDAI